MHALLANVDLLRLALAALIVGLVMATARTVLGRLHAGTYLAITTLAISQHNWPATYVAMAYGAVMAALQIRSARRRTATA